MASIDYDEIRREADLSIREAGASFTLKQFGTGDYDAELSEIDRSETIYEGSAFRESYEIKDIDGSLVTDKDVKLIVSGLQTDGSAFPQAKPGDECTFAGSAYTVQRCTPWNFAGIAVGFEIQARIALNG